MFVNEHQKGKEPSIKRLTCKLFAVNVATCLLDLSILTYYIIIIYRLHKYNDMKNVEGGTKSNNLVQNTSIFIATILAIGAFAIWASFFVMYDVLRK